MAETVQSLEGLATLKPAAPEAPKYEKKVDAQGRAYATGKRKNAVARVWIKPGSGKILVNTKAVEVFFARPVLRMLICVRSRSLRSTSLWMNVGACFWMPRKYCSYRVLRRSSDLSTASSSSSIASVGVTS